MRPICLIVFALLVSACSEDEAGKQPATVKTPVTAVKPADTKPAPRSGTRSVAPSFQTGFAGFGRVGRSSISNADYRARWAVIVGINRYDHMGQLKNASNDARGLRDLLRDEFGYDNDRVIYLVDEEEESEESRRLRGSFAEKMVTQLEPIFQKDLLGAFEKLASEDIRANDAVLIFFAGHGKSDENGAYIAARDSKPDDLGTWVNVKRVVQQLSSTVPARHKLLILDSCYAGSILDVDLSKGSQFKAKASPATSQGESAAVSRGSGNEALELRDNLAFYLQEPAFLAITSGRDQPVGDAAAKNASHSPFTQSLLDVLRARANSVRDDDVFTAREMAVRVESMVSKGQTPDWGRLEAGRGDFVFKPTLDRLTPREIAERDNYAIRVTLASIKIAEGKLDKAEVLLQGCPQHLRHFEWHRLWAFIDESYATVRGPAGKWMSVALSANGERVAAKSTTGTHVTWTPTNGEVDLIYNQGSGRGNVPEPVAISADGTRVALVWEFAKIQVRDVGQPMSRLLHDFPHGQNAIYAMAMSADGKRIVTGGQDKIIKVWNVEAGKEPLAVLHGHEQSIQSLAINSDGTRIASTGADGTIRIWEPDKSDQSIHVLAPARDAGPKARMSVANQGDGSRIVFSQGQLVKAWDVLSTDKQLKTFSGHVGDIQSVAVSADGKRVAAGGDDGFIRVWDYEKPDAPRFTFRGHKDRILSVAINADGRQIVSGSDDGSIKLWRTQQGQRDLVLSGRKGEVTSVAISKNGGRVFTAGGSIKIWDAVRGPQPLFTLPGHDKGTASIAVSPGGERIVTGGNDHTVKVWDARRAANPLFSLVGHTGTVTAVVYSPDGKRIYTSSDDKTINVWDSERSGEPITTLRGHRGEVTCLAITEDGKRLISGGSDGAVLIWNAIQGGKPLHSLRGHNRAVSSIAVDADGHCVITGSKDWTVKVWNPDRSEKAILTLRDEDGPINDVALSADGERIFSAGDDGTLKIWEADRMAEPLLVLRGHQGAITALGISADGKRVVSVGVDGIVHVWNSAGWPR